MRQKFLFTILVLAVSVAPCGAAHRDFGEGGSSRGDGVDGGHTRIAGSPVIMKMQRYNVPKPNVIRNPQHVLRGDGRVNWPERDERGVRITQRASIAPPSQHTAIVNNSAVVKNIRHNERVEIIPNHYYWHNDRGIRYAHLYDHGIHWYGFYHGPSFYWCRFYGDRWWWFDVSFGRWVYWWDGYWWWPAPTGLVYVYVDNNYYPYEEGGVVVKKPEVSSPPTEIPAATQGSDYTSPDNNRMVQIFGSRREAFLYDKSAGNPVFLKYLGQGVVKVRFTGGKPGKQLQILVDYDDGNFALFTGNGDPVDAEASVATPPLPTEPPPAPPSGN